MVSIEFLQTAPPPPLRKLEADDPTNRGIFVITDDDDDNNYNINENESSSLQQEQEQRQQERGPRSSKLDDALDEEAREIDILFLDDSPTNIVTNAETKGYEVGRQEIGDDEEEEEELEEQEVQKEEVSEVEEERETPYDDEDEEKIHSKIKQDCDQDLLLDDDLQNEHHSESREDEDYVGGEQDILLRELQNIHHKQEEDEDYVGEQDIRLGDLQNMVSALMERLEEKEFQLQAFKDLDTSNEEAVVLRMQLVLAESEKKSLREEVENLKDKVKERDREILTLRLEDLEGMNGGFRDGVSKSSFIRIDANEWRRMQAERDTALVRAGELAYQLADAKAEADELHDRLEVAGTLLRDHTALLKKFKAQAKSRKDVRDYFSLSFSSSTASSSSRSFSVEEEDHGDGHSVSSSDEQQDADKHVPGNEESVAVVLSI